MIDIEIDKAGLADLERLTRGTKIYDRALTTTVNKLARAGSTAVSRQIRGKYTIKARDLKAKRGGTSNRNGLRVQRARRGQTTAFILGAGRALPLIRFRVTPKTPEADNRRKRRRGITYRVQRGKRVRVRDAFVARMDSGHVGAFMRKRESRTPIRELFGPSIPQMLKETASLNAIFQRIQEDAPRVLEQELRFRVRKEMGLG